LIRRALAWGGGHISVPELDSCSDPGQSYVQV